jgi:hypothetical protein
MANGRALPSALLFDWLLGRAWNMAMTSYANAHRFGVQHLGGSFGEAGLSVGGAPAGMERFLSQYHSGGAAALVAGHDQALRGQLAEVANYWAEQFNQVLVQAVPVGPGFTLAAEWLRAVVNGADGLAYLGQDKRLAQAQGYAGQEVNPYALPLPAGALAALQGVAGRTAGLHVQRLDAQMRADRAAEAHRLRIDAAEALLRAYNAALDATMEHLFTQMHLMFDVFGRNNNYLVNLQRKAQDFRDLAALRTQELAGWNERIMTTDDSHAAAIRKIGAAVERANTIDAMSADAHIRLLRRYSSRAAAALNSAGVSVNSTASESNTIDAGV